MSLTCYAMGIPRDKLFPGVARPRVAIGIKNQEEKKWKMKPDAGGYYSHKL